MSKSKQLTGDDLIKMGYEPSKFFGEMLKIANEIYESQDDIPEVLEALDLFVEQNTPVPVETIPLQDELDIEMFIDIPEEDGFEKDNVLSALMHAKAVSTVPTIRKVVLMPDACPAGGQLGTIPVGCVAVAEDAIHPGMHSADICCSMFLTSLDCDITHRNDVKTILDIAQEVTHFGMGGRKDFPMGHHHYILEQAQNNRFLASVQMLKAMSDHHMTQGDGNHFFYVGKKESTGDLTFVTHHGSRSPGALLYKEGMRVAEQFRQELSPDTPKHNAWIPANTDEGRWYWEALQIIREWTKYNHQSIHNEMMRRLHFTEFTDRFWNEHNFVFKRDNMYYHAKGSTPVFGNYAHDADYMGRTIVPLNMGEPILIITDHLENDFGFAPHGAGRNMSRTAFMKQNGKKTVEQIMKEQVGHIDARFYTGKPDASELPGAYKNAEEVQRQIRDYKLANVVDRILPLGSIMAGEFDKPWRKK